MNQLKKIVFLVLLIPFIFCSCASNGSPKTLHSSAETENPIFYYVNSKATTAAEFAAFVEKLNSEKISLSHEETKDRESTFYRLKDARGHLFQVSDIRENHRRTMSVNVLSGQ